MDSNKNMRSLSKPFDETFQVTWQNMASTNGNLTTVIRNEIYATENTEKNFAQCENFTNQYDKENKGIVDNNITDQNHKLDNMNYNNWERMETEDIMNDSLNVNEGYHKLETRTTLPKSKPRGKKKLTTWKDISPSSSKDNLVGREMSDSFGSPKRSQSWDASQSNGNPLVTWKDLSPSKIKGKMRPKSVRKKRPESGYYSNDVQSEGQDSREDFDSLSGSDQMNNAHHSSSSTPDDAGFSEYYYDEDFIVKFDSNIRNSSLKLKEVKQEDELMFPVSFNGSYTRFGNLRESFSHPDLCFGHYESELSGSRTSMEVSSSEREMMCSSDMLDFSNDPLFTPTPTGEIVAHTYSTDSLSQDPAISTHSRSSSESKLTVDCCPRKEEYFLSFNSSSQGQSTVSLSSNSYASQTSSQDGSPSCSSNDGEEICSNSFHFCEGGANIKNMGNPATKGGLDVVPEQSIEKSEFSSFNSSRRSPGNTKNSSHTKKSTKLLPNKWASVKLLPSKGTYGSLDGQQKMCGTDKQQSLKRVKNLTSWKQVKNLKTFGVLCNSSDCVHSMPELDAHTDLQDLSDSFHKTRQSSSLLELYQRMKSPNSMVSLDAIRAVEQLLFPENSIYRKFNNQYQHIASSTESSSGSDQACGCKVGEDIDGMSRTKGKYSRSSFVPQEKVKFWHGTKNFSSQFPPRTNDCGVQASMDEPDSVHSISQSQQTSPNSNRDIITILEDIGLHISRKSQKEFHQRIATSETRQKQPEPSTLNRRSSSLSPSRLRNQKFYSHLSLPDLSFLSASHGGDVMYESSSLFDPVKIPIILTPVVDDSQQTQSSQRESGYSSCVKEKCTSRSGSSIGFCNSSSSSGIDAGYECSCCKGMARDLERILFSPPHLECAHNYIPRHETLHNHNQSNENYYIGSDSECDSHLSSQTRHKLNRKISARSTSNSTSSLYLDKLYTFKEENHTSVEKSERYNTEFDGDHNLPASTYCGYHLSGNMEKRYHHVDYFSVDEDDMCHSIQIEEDSSSNQKPLKSCLRKMDKGCRTRSLSNPDNLNIQLNDSPKQTSRPARYSIACDCLFPQNNTENTERTEIKTEFLMMKDTKDKEILESDPNCNSFEDMNKANKRVSFATEVLFQSPQCSPQVSPQHLPKVKSIEIKDEEPKVEKSEPVPPEKPRRIFASTPPADFTFSDIKNIDQIGSGDCMQLNRDNALLTNITSAAEALVLHFAQARDPFDKVRLGSAAETPEVGTLVFRKLCPAMEQMIEDGMKPHRTGTHVFSKIHITPWKIAEMSAEVGPYTRSINQLVNQLKSRTTLLSNKQRFYAFLAGLLNLRLLDFWVGYIRTKDDLVDNVYHPEAILKISKNHLDSQYSQMLLALQPLSALPFQIDYDLVAETPAGYLSTLCEPKPESNLQKLKDAVTPVKSAIPKSVSESDRLTGLARNRFGWSGNKSLTKAKSISSGLTSTNIKPKDGIKKFSTFTSVRPKSSEKAKSSINMLQGNTNKKEPNVQEKCLDGISPCDYKRNKAMEVQQSTIECPTNLLLNGEFPVDKISKRALSPCKKVSVTGLIRKFSESQSGESLASSIEKGDGSSSSLSMKALLDESPVKSNEIKSDASSKPMQSLKTMTAPVDKNKEYTTQSHEELKVGLDGSKIAFSSLSIDSECIKRVNNKACTESLDEVADGVFGNYEPRSQKSSLISTINGKPSDERQSNSTFAVIEASPIMHAQLKPEKHSHRTVLQTKGCGHSKLAPLHDNFKLTEFRYSVALVSYESTDVDCLSFDEGDYVEVLAQLDSDWLFCAKGSQEGLVRISAVRPITVENEFELMHNDFYQ